MGKQTITLGQLLEQMKEWILEFSTLPTMTHVHPTWQVPSWTALKSPCSKINFDEAIFDKDNNAGLGVVIQNNEGLVMASLSQLIPFVSNGHWGGNFGNKMSTWTGRKRYSLPYLALLAFNLSHVCRHCNKVAYSFAKKRKKKKKSNSFPPLLVWMEDVGNSNILPIFCKKFGNMPLFWNSILRNSICRKSSMGQSNLKKKKKTCMELEFLALEFHLKRHYRTLWM